jgi:trigger factor
MQVSIETTSGLERRMTIVVPSEDFEDRVQQKLQDTARRVRLDGFRPGKVPLREVRRRFGKAVRQEVAGELMQNSFFEAVREENVMPAGAPNLEVLNMDPGVDLEFTATFEVLPSIDLVRFSNVQLKRPTADVDDAAVEKTIERLREQHRTWEPVERASRAGDKVSIDFVGRIDGEAFDGGSGEDVEVELGGGRMLEDFERGLTGLATGANNTFDVRFPDDYAAESLRARTAQFEVTIKAVAESKPAELDDEFFASYGIKEGGLEAFRAEVAESMRHEIDSATRNALKQQVMNELDRLHEVQLPEALVQREVEGLREQMIRQLQLRGTGQRPELPAELFRDEARRRVKLGLVMNALIEREKLEADPARVRSRIEELASQYQHPQQVVEFYYSNEQQLGQIEMAVLEDQAVERVIEQASVTEIPSNYEDIIAGKFSPDADADGTPEPGTESTAPSPSGPAEQP